MVINDIILVEILNKLDDSINELLSKQEFRDWKEMESFLDERYDSLLDRILHGKASNIHHLESGMKNKVIVRKQRLFDHLKEGFQKGEK